MRIDTSFLHSKLARRIFLMFVTCALLPIGGLFLLSYSQVTEQLNAQSHKRLMQSARLSSLSVYEKLQFLEAEMQLVSSAIIKLNSTQTGKVAEVELSDPLKDHFNGLQLHSPGLGTLKFFGQINHPPKPTLAEIQHIQSGKTAIKTTYDLNSWPRIFMLRLLNREKPETGYLLGEINPAYLWGAGHDNALPLNMRFCAFDDSKNLLYSTFEDAGSLSDHIEGWLKDANSDVAEWFYNNQIYVVSPRTIFLKPNFLVPNWTIVLFQSKSDVLKPISQFKKMFILVAIITLLVVLLLSIAYLRKRFVPLEVLKEGTRKISMKDFDSRVTVHSNDEFEELADAFNEMSGRLSRQFKTLVTKAEIDRAILSSLEPEKIVQTAMTRMQECFSYDDVSISLVDSEKDHTVHTYICACDSRSAISKRTVRIDAQDLQTLHANPQYFFIEAGHKIPAYLLDLEKNGSRAFMVLPVFLKEKLAAIIAFAQSDQTAQNEEELHLVRQIADQVAVALANSNLIEELNRLNWGTLKALAGTVDAKSSWTAGHSERVADIGLKIGKTLGLESGLLINLQRAAFLHDIGKIGVPVAILDKPGKLNPEEFDLIKAHPRIGARILKPIKAYDEIIPMVLQHHERYDGKGYPDGLNENSINWGARILAVADVFDALKSDRPYRDGLPFEQVIGLIRQESGHQFDPEVVKAFLAVVEWKGTKAA